MRKVVSPGGATKPAATFEVGDKVVLYPTAVMTITAIGPHKVKPAGPVRALVGDATLQPVPDDAVAYVLRFLGAAQDAFAVDVKATTRPPMRHLSTAAEIVTFLAILGDTLQDARVTAPPPELAKELDRAGNDLVKLARLFPYLRDTDDFQKQARATLDALFVQELAIVRGLDERDARALLERL